jgi:hypothetical protein
MKRGQNPTFHTTFAPLVNAKHELQRAPISWGVVFCNLSFNRDILVILSFLVNG